MTEEEYKLKLLEILKSFVNNEISKEDFVLKAKELGKEFDKNGHKGNKDFKDKELGWAKYWIEEVDFYGIDEVLNNHFDFIKFYNESK